MNKNREKKQQRVSESEYDRNLGIAASVGAVIGGAAFAAAAYSTGIWETESDEGNEASESVEGDSANEMIQPETISIEISNPVTADITYTTDALLSESEGIDIINTENDEIVIQDIEYPDEGEILQSDMQNVMDLVTEETIDIPLMENVTYDDNTIIEDSHQLL